MNLSYWERTSFFKETDYTIVGAGIVGLFAALELKNKNPKANVLVLERALLPNGASTKNAGFACFGSLSELIVQLEKSSEEELIDLVSKRWQGLQKLKTTLGEENIDFKNWGGYEVFTQDDEVLWEKCKTKINYFNSLLKSTIAGEEPIYQIADEKIDVLGLKNVKHLLFNPYEAQIHSGKMMDSLIQKCYAAGIKILYGFEVISFENLNVEVKVLNAKSDISFQTKKLLICNNAFSKKLIPTLDIVPGRGQVFITKPIQNLSLKGTFHFDEGYYYFRNIDDRVLIGGGRNLDFENEATTLFGITDTIKNKITTLLNTVVLPGIDWEYDMEWSGIMAFGNELKPIIKEVHPNVYCAVRCNGMGVAMGSKIGEELALLVTRSS